MCCNHFLCKENAKRANTLAVLKTTFLQSGRMLTDQAGRKYTLPLNVTFASELLS